MNCKLKKETIEGFSGVIAFAERGRLAPFVPHSSTEHASHSTLPMSYLTVYKRML